MSPAWDFYFLAKLLLHARGHLTVDPVLSGLLLACVMAPLPRARWRAPLLWALAAALAWRESWLPPPSRVGGFLSDPAIRPSWSYALSFLAGSVNWRLTVGLAALAAAVAWAARGRRRLWPAALAGLAAVAFLDPGALRRGAAERGLAAFYAGEAGRRVAFAKPAGPPFDVILIHVCSMSWEDLSAAGLEGDPFWKEFQAVFTRFNSATSDSNMAALRLLRAPCGQVRGEELFDDVPVGCLLLGNLRRLGYSAGAAWAHDGGEFFSQDLKEYAGEGEPLDLKGLPAAKLSYDNSPVYDDRAVLERWWSKRQRSGAARAALYYNTSALHAGVHPSQGKNDWLVDPARRYREAARGFFPALSSFFRLVEKSGRRAVVILVAEHGAALKGSSIQPPALRDIPLPQIFEVPAAIKIIGPGAPGPAGSVERPASYLALAELLRRFLERPPFGPRADLSAALTGLPEPSLLVAQNWAATVLESGGRWRVKLKSGRWRTLPKSAVREAAY